MLKDFSMNDVIDDLKVKISSLKALYFENQTRLVGIANQNACGLVYN